MHLTFSRAKWGQRPGSKEDIDGKATDPVGHERARYGRPARIAHTVPLVIAGALSSIANLASTVLVAHLIGAVAYGSLVQLLALFLVLSMPGTALMVGVVRRVAALEIRGQGSLVKSWVRRVHRAGLGGVGVLAVTVWLARGPIVSLLALPNSRGVVEILTAGGCWVLVSVDRGILQAWQDYRDLSVNLVVEGSVRTLAMIGLAAAGMGLEGAALGLLIAELAAVAHARWKVATMLPRRHELPVDEVVTVGVDGAAHRSHLLHTRRDLAADVATALGCLALLAVLQNADTILVGSLAPGSKDAYAAISVPSKALIFWALTLGNYLLPEATIRFHQGGQALRQLAHTLAILVPFGAGLLIVAVALPKTFLTLVFERSGSKGAAGFASLVLAMLFLCVTVLLTSYLLGAGRRWITALLGAGAASLVVTTALSRGRIVVTVHRDLVVQAVLAGAMVIAVALVHRQAERPSGKALRGG